eukprot:CAMPEP_0202890936 /NCGR_PEP_ID=MMETSP1392-20130828/1173_1 /ASSEMBLY_ACC=CAM_ASM_000868 /TAXON_ID=225041 /ORGANISM="Chlamydomonas chlamydogama, Strain SAG 11-48b" /LENGTH=309 /DNA_ID=CAMNT_0049574591 /DNA_START=24 /DNA_END=953 /DNA_ORIENTATION=-
MASNVSFQFCSDLHLELHPGFRITTAEAPYLILAGDIGDPRTQEYVDFLTDCASKFEGVFVVLGNHEAYGNSWVGAQQAAQRAASLPHLNDKVKLLQRSRYDIVPGKLRIVGTTLWSHVPGEDAYEVRCNLNDYHLIQGFSVADSNEEHRQDVAWLRAETALAEADGVRLVVVTHHAPLLTGTSHPQFLGSPTNCAFATDLSHLMRAPIALWVFGHTHFCSRQVKGPGSVVVVSNQRGYADIPEEAEMFRPSAVETVQLEEQRQEQGQAPAQEPAPPLPSHLVQAPRPGSPLTRLISCCSSGQGGDKAE